MSADSYHFTEGGISMKEKIKLRSSFTAQSTEQLRQRVTKKIEKLINTKPKKAS